MSGQTLHVELVAADRVVWSGQSSEVIARTTEGDLGVLVGHAPLLSLLAHGLVQIHAEDGTTVTAAVAGGFLSVAADRVSILSEGVFLPSDLDEVAAKAELADAQSREDADAQALAEAKLRLLAS